MDLSPLYKTIFPILQEEETGKLTIAGTAILVNYLERPFLVTAAHILQNNGSKFRLFLLLKDIPVYLGGPADITRMIEGTDVDIAIFDVWNIGELSLHLKDYKYVPLEEPAENVIPNYTRQHYLIIGFPATKTKYTQVNILKECVPLEYVTSESNQVVYKKYSINRKYSTLVDYKQKQTHNSKLEKTTAPKPHGSSGGALLRIYIDKDDKPIMLIFHGILIEWKNNEFIVATNKSVISDIIEKKFLLFQ